MKKDTITVSVDAEKFHAIKRYMDKKEVDLQDELSVQLQKLYEKYVPVNVRKYIDEREEGNMPAKLKKPTKMATVTGDDGTA